MNHRAVQQWMVRMLHDPDLVDRIYADPEAALVDAQLDQRERAWLVRPDKRAWKTDPYRRARLLTGLVDEYPTAMARALRHGGTAPLLGFFSAPAFAACVHERGSLALNFGEWLVDNGPRPTAALARVELAIARVRRGRPPPGAPADDPTANDFVTLSPTLDPCAVPDGTVEQMAKIRARLEQHPAGLREAVADQMYAVGLDGTQPLDSRATKLEHVLVDIGPEGPQLGFGPAALVALLDAARSPVQLATLWTRALQLGAEPGDEREIVTGLVVEGSLVRLPTK